MRFPLLRTLLVPQTSVSREGQRGERNSCLQVPPKPGQVVKKPLVNVWVMLRSIPASVCSSLTLWDSRALLHSVLIVPFIIMLHQLTTFKQPKEKKNAAPGTEQCQQYSSVTYVLFNRRFSAAPPGLPTALPILHSCT